MSDKLNSVYTEVFVNGELHDCIKIDLWQSVSNHHYFVINMKKENPAYGKQM